MTRINVLLGWTRASRPSTTQTILVIGIGIGIGGLAAAAAPLSLSLLIFPKVRKTASRYIPGTPADEVTSPRCRELETPNQGSTAANNPHLPGKQNVRGGGASPAVVSYPPSHRFGHLVSRLSHACPPLARSPRSLAYLTTRPTATIKPIDPLSAGVQHNSPVETTNPFVSAMKLLTSIGGPSKASCSSTPLLRLLAVAVVSLLSLRIHPSDAQTFPTMAPSSVCPSEIESWAMCLADNNLDGEACVDCYFAYADLVTDDTTCEELNTLACDQIGICESSCGPPCGTYLEAYVACLFEGICDVSCAGNPTTPTFPTSPVVAPAPSPTTPSFPTAPASPTASTTECESELDALGACVASTGNVDGCVSCLETYNGGSGTVTTCDEAQAYACGILEACPDCGDCQDEQAAVVNCQNEGTCDAFECSSSPTTAAVPTTTTSPPPAASPVAAAPSPGASPPTASGGGDDACPSEFDDVQDCLATEVSQAEATNCESCVTEALQGSGLGSGQDVPSCSAINSAICPALASDSECGCGTCADEIETYLACQVDAATAGCELDCGTVNGEGSGPTAASGPTAPTPTSGGGLPPPTNLISPTSGAATDHGRVNLVTALLAGVAGVIATTMIGSVV